MQKKIAESFDRLKSYIEKEDFRGWDPFDGLNSKVFQSISGIRDSRFFRLAWIQFFKRSPINLRKILFVPKGFNSKGLGLFLNGYCNLYKVDPQEEYFEIIIKIAEQLLELKSKGYSGACWGYNFDWQARAFFQPKQTPTVVATTFIGYALFDAYEITQKQEYLETAISIKDFILKDLNRTYDQAGDFAFSYSPLDQTQVFNASLLGSRMLSRIYSYTKEQILVEKAKKSVDFCMKYQKEDGSWPYSPLPFHQWIDSFHTGFNLECISEYQKYSRDQQYLGNIERGLKFYIENFFTEQGEPKYYHNQLYPIDIHAPAQLIVTLCRLQKLKKYKELAEKVLLWIIEEMQDKKGYFYYQINKNYKIKIPYIRWSQAWMFYAFSMINIKRSVENKLSLAKIAETAKSSN